MPKKRCLKFVNRRWRFYGERTLLSPVFREETESHDRHVSVVLLNGVVEHLVSLGVQNFGLSLLNDVELLSLPCFSGQFGLGSLSRLGRSRRVGFRDVHGGVSW